MPAGESEQTELKIGVDVGGTFTDLVAWDGSRLQIVKIPSTPPDFHRAVIEAVGRVRADGVPRFEQLVHGSTVATNALLQRAGQPTAFITTHGFRDLLLIGRQNRPRLYAMSIERPQPLTPEENWFTVRERIDASGNVIEPLVDAEMDRVVGWIVDRGLQHVAICFLFSFINSTHERQLGARCARAGLTISLSCDILPEFREYERASTTVINASLRPIVEQYLRLLERGLSDAKELEQSAAGPADVHRLPGIGPAEDRRFTPTHELRIMHSAGGTLAPAEAAASAAKLVLSGPAGGVIGAALVARQNDFPNVITYDMGGTSTDVATIVAGQPQWTTQSEVGGLPIGLPAFDIVTVGAGGGSIAYLDAGGALRVGPRSAGAVPGPACYGRGGAEPAVTDANLVLGRILPDAFAGGTMRIDLSLARDAILPLANAMGKSVEEAALGIVRVAEQNMSLALRAVTSRRGLDPRDFALVSFGGAGGLHACALAESLDIARVVVPPYCGVLSALGMAAAAPVVDVSKTVAHLGEQLDDARLAAEFGNLNLQATERLPQERTASVEAYADVRFRGQSYELKVRVTAPRRALVAAAFEDAYRARYGGQLPSGRAIEIVTLRMRRIGYAPALALPKIEPNATGMDPRRVRIVDGNGQAQSAIAVARADLLAESRTAGPMLVIDPEATTYVPAAWEAVGRSDGTLILTGRR